MPPKKKKGSAGEAPPGEDPYLLLSNYNKFSRLIGVTANPKIVAQLQNVDAHPLEQLVCDDEYGSLGPGGTRALTTAILGSGQDMKGGPYKLLKGLRLWRANCGDEGTRSLAELLRLGGGEIKLEYLELLDSKLGPVGALALGHALSVGCNQSLLTLKLDYNLGFGSDGAKALCRGLRTNCTLKQLHLPYCSIEAGGGAAIGEMLSYSRLQLTVLNLQGNRLGSKGINDMAPGLSHNRSLSYISLADNTIGGTDEDLESLEVFRDAMMACTTLTHIDLLYNRIGSKGANILLPALAPENTQIKQFLVDATLPNALFEALHRRDSGAAGKKKKGGSGKGAKKKKK